MITIKRIELLRVELPLIRKFIVSFGTLTHRDIVLVKLHTDDGAFGWGEAPTINWPVYKPEYPGTVCAVIKDVIAPTILDKTFETPEDLDKALNFIRGHYFAKAAISMAAYDIFAKKQNKSIRDLVGATQAGVTISKTISIYEDVGQTVAEGQGYYDEGIRWLKLKIKPGCDIKQVEALRKTFPDCKLMVDANASYAYTPETIELFKALESYDLFCIEQPLAWDDLVYHAKLQEHLKTPVALDESIDSAQGTRQALEIQSCRAVNIKVARVGGLTSSREIHDLCLERNIPTWTGGMVESPVGFAVNLAFAGMKGCLWPIDFMESEFLIANSHQYFDELPYTVQGDQLTFACKQPGLGFTLNETAIDKACLSREVFENSSQHSLKSAG
ncbi:MAG: o-succinylbenzoate synthase [Micavibrio sp.]